MMLLESLILGSVALNAITTLVPRLLGMGERVSDSRNFTISLAAVGPEVTITSLEAPSELNAGQIPLVKVTVEHTRSVPEWVFARIRDKDTGNLVTGTHKTYMLVSGTHVFTFQGLAPQGDWGAVMPNKDWNLQLEVGLWWL